MVQKKHQMFNYLHSNIFKLIRIILIHSLSIVLYLHSNIFKLILLLRNLKKLTNLDLHSNIFKLIRYYPFIALL